MNAPVLQDYQRLLQFYARQLHGSVPQYGRRFELLFARIIDLLNRPSRFNATLPRTFIDIAQRISLHDAALRYHFRHDGNRQQFLRELEEYLQWRRREQQRRA